MKTALDQLKLQKNVEAGAAKSDATVKVVDKKFGSDVFVECVCVCVFVYLC